MKNLLFLLSVILTLGLASCEKCYECSADLPIFVNGVQMGSTPITVTECGRGSVINDKVDALEENDYECVKQ